MTQEMDIQLQIWVPSDLQWSALLFLPSCPFFAKGI